MREEKNESLFIKYFLTKNLPYYPLKTTSFAFVNDCSRNKIMKYSREYILKRAFDVFISKGYDSTSITVLQKELNMSRGAMYRYFKNKEDLFFAVIDRYFFRLYNKTLLGFEEDYTVPSLMDELYKRQKLMAKVFYKSGMSHTVFLNYTALIIQAAKYYPNFIARFLEIQNKYAQTWKEALQKSIDKKEIRSDINIDITCKLFNITSFRESSECDDNEAYDNKYKFTKDVLADIEKRREVMLYLYSLIKL